MKSIASEHHARLQDYLREQKIRNKLIHQYTSEFMQLPKEDDKISLWRRLPIIYIPFMFRRRILQLIIFTGNDLKSGVLNEFSQHILVETLLLIPICSQVFNTQFAEPETWNIRVGCVYTLFISTCVFLLCAVVSNIQFVCAFVQIHDR